MNEKAYSSEDDSWIADVSASAGLKSTILYLSISEYRVGRVTPNRSEVFDKLPFDRL